VSSPPQLLAKIVLTRLLAKLVLRPVKLVAATVSFISDVMSAIPTIGAATLYWAIGPWPVCPENI